MGQLEYTVETAKSFDQAVNAVEAKSAEKGFRVLHTHDFAATLAGKGFPREPLKLIEICNARYANEALAKDIRLALMLPCPISVYREGGKTYISAFRPSAIAKIMPESQVERLADDVEKVVLEIVNEAKD